MVKPTDGQRASFGILSKRGICVELIFHNLQGYMIKFFFHIKVKKYYYKKSNVMI